MGKKKRKYVGENLKLFMDFLPEEIYRNLNKEDYRNYKEYRRYQRFIGESNIRVDKMEKEITKLQTKINNEKLKIKGVDSEHSGWEQKMVLHYDGISYLHKDLHFWCSTSPRKRTSKSKRTKDGNVRLNKKDTEYGIQKNSYKGEELKDNYLWYSRIENSNIRKDIYLGHESDIRNFLSDILNENWSKDDISEVK